MIGYNICLYGICGYGMWNYGLLHNEEEVEETEE